jgi:RAT1-interacting protein
VETDRPQQRLRLDDDPEAPAILEPNRSTLAYPRGSDRVNPTPFQLPTQITSFSYDENHQQLFDDSALHYYVDPPPNARLDFAYDRWVRKPDTRGRLDPLLKAIQKAREDHVKAALVPDNGVVCWRGIMTN